MISFDTSTTDTGYAIWENAKLVRYGDLDLSNVVELKSRTDFMIQRIHALVECENPDIMIVEALSVFNDIKTDSNLSDIIGSTRGYALACEDCWFDKLLTFEWRGLVADGETIPRKRVDCKAWDIKRLYKLFGIKTNNDNIADAVLIGLAYCRLFCEDNAVFMDEVDK